MNLLKRPAFDCDRLKRRETWKDGVKIHVGKYNARYMKRK